MTEDLKKRIDALHPLFANTQTILVDVDGKFNDDGTEMAGYTIGIGAFDEDIDYIVFYWCDSVKDFESLFSAGIADFTLTDFHSPRNI